MNRSLRNKSRSDKAGGLRAEGLARAAVQGCEVGRCGLRAVDHLNGVPEGAQRELNPKEPPHNEPGAKPTDLSLSLKGLKQGMDASRSAMKHTFLAADGVE